MGQDLTEEDFRSSWERAADQCEAIDAMHGYKPPEKIIREITWRVNPANHGAFFDVKEIVAWMRREYARGFVDGGTASRSSR